MQSYFEFLDLSVGFPQDGFGVADDELTFQGINLMDLIETYGTPLRFTYLPMISKKIQQAKLWFQQAINNKDYRGTYTYCYCTKSAHFMHVLEEALKNDIQLETSSAFDMPIIEALEKKGLISKETMVICNGFKPRSYLENIADLIHDGFSNIIPILDNKEELNFFNHEVEGELKVGLRVATEEKPDFEFYTSRLGIRGDEILDFYQQRLHDHPRIKNTMLHFFIDSGIRDTPYFWNELEKYVTLYCQLAKKNPHLHALDIGGGLPFKNSLAFEYDFEYMINEIVSTIKGICEQHEVKEPDLITEFGNFTVAESGAILFKVLGKKQQNDREKWLMIDGSVITMIPDVWGVSQRFILLPVNNWDNEYEKVNIGGITCDSQDYYGQDSHINSVFMPKTRKQQYMGFFHTGAYQENLSGMGGLSHCLIPTPKQVLISKNQDGTLQYKVLHEEQISAQMLKLLGY